jgi:hypothetical protein
MDGVITKYQISKPIIFRKEDLFLNVCGAGQFITP